MRPLGDNQKGVLELLGLEGFWIPERSAWDYGDVKNTVRILDSLIKRGLVTKRMITEHPTRKFKFPEPEPIYELVVKDTAW